MGRDFHVKNHMLSKVEVLGRLLFFLKHYSLCCFTSIFRTRGFTLSIFLIKRSKEENSYIFLNCLLLFGISSSPKIPACVKFEGS
jgi:hypothetical protein